MKNQFVESRAAKDIDHQVEKILQGLGNPAPPLNLDLVRDLLKLDRGYYTGTDDGALIKSVFWWMQVSQQRNKDGMKVMRLFIASCPGTKTRRLAITKERSLRPAMRRWSGRQIMEPVSSYF